MAEQISFGTGIDARGGPHVQVRVWAGKRLTDRALCGSLTMLPDEAEELCKRLSDDPFAGIPLVKSALRGGGMHG